MFWFIFSFLESSLCSRASVHVCFCLNYNYNLPQENLRLVVTWCVLGGAEGLKKRPTFSHDGPFVAQKKRHVLFVLHACVYDSR